MGEVSFSAKRVLGGPNSKVMRGTGYPRVSDVNLPTRPRGKFGTPDSSTRQKWASARSRPPQVPRLADNTSFSTARRNDKGRTGVDLIQVPQHSAAFKGRGTLIHHGKVEIFLFD
jgi:hypothetical protein